MQGMSFRNSYIGLAVAFVTLGVGYLIAGGDRTYGESQAIGAGAFIAGFLVLTVLDRRGSHN
ncbi:MAG TPA: hypothetical protein VEX36_00590 [Thermoleophilaceae bacterium]|nr:hypothetical protein [Thermoleophilaceae bacterium]